MRRSGKVCCGCGHRPLAVIVELPRRTDSPHAVPSPERLRAVKAERRRIISHGEKDLLTTRADQARKPIVVTDAAAIERVRDTRAAS